VGYFAIRLKVIFKFQQVSEIPLEGTHHLGIDDARNIAKIAQIVFST